MVYLLQISSDVFISYPSAPEDYIGGSFGVSIPGGTTKATLSVSTLRDSIVEPDEYFKATLTLPGAPVGCAVGTPDVAFITIQDNTCKLQSSAS